MCRKLLLVYLLLLGWLHELNAQNVILNIVDCQDNSHIAYYTIFNKNKNTFSVSDKKSPIKVYADKGDSLHISHLAYGDTLLIVNNKNINLCLQSKKVMLDEIVFTGVKNDTHIRGNIRKKTKAMYAIAYDSEYAIEFNFKIQGMYLSEIKIPVKYRFQLDALGVVVIALYKNCNGVPCEIINEPIYIEVNQSSKFLTYTFDNPIKIPSNNIFMVFRRLKPNSEFFIFPEKKLSSVNPFFKIIEPENQRVYRRKISDTIWREIDPEIEVVPVIKLQLTLLDD